jgi:hypothetical protein
MNEAVALQKLIASVTTTSATPEYTTSTGCCLVLCTTAHVAPSLLLILVNAVVFSFLYSAQAFVAAFRPAWQAYHGAMVRELCDMCCGLVAQL